MRKGVLRNFAKCTGNTCARVSYLTKWQVPAALLKKTLAQVFSYKFCDFLKKADFYRTPPVTASGSLLETCLQSLIPSTHHSEIPY